MKRFRRGTVFSVVACIVALWGCPGDDMEGPQGGDPPPDLTGTYTLVSFTQAGFTRVPPAVMGTFTIAETSSSTSSASGTVEVDITVPDGMGGLNQIMDSGTYTIRSDGTWEQNGQLGQTIGTYSLVGGTLTVVTTSPASAANTSVWERQ